MHNQSYRGWTCMMFPSCSTYKQLHWRRRHYAMTRIYIRILLWNMLHEILTSCVAVVLSGFHSWSSCMRGCLTCFCPLQPAMWMYFRMRRRWYGTGGIAWGCRMTNVNIIYDIYILQSTMIWMFWYAGLHLAILHRFSIQICTAARNATKHSAPWVLFLQDKCATTCPVGEDFLSSNIFIPGSQMPFWFHMLPNSVPILIGSEYSRLVSETQDVFLGEWLVTTCPVTKERYAFGTWRPLS